MNLRMMEMFDIYDTCRCNETDLKCCKSQPPLYISVILKQIKHLKSITATLFHKIFKKYINNKHDKSL